MLWLAGWCVLACVVLAYAARRVRLREAQPGGVASHLQQ
jgi:hypothetical protein